MESEASQFETSDMLATFVSSTPLLADAWTLCSRSNTAAPRSFLSAEIGGVAYISFSGIQAVAAGSQLYAGKMVPLAEVRGLFSVLDSQQLSGDAHGEDGEMAAAIHAGFLHLFLEVYNTHRFRNEIFEILKKGKPVVFTGHSIGAAIASLSTLWLLCYLRSVSSPLPVLCVTFGSPMLGNESLSRAVLRERWGGSFLHVVANCDIVPRLLFAPLARPVGCLLDYWHLSMASPSSCPGGSPLTEAERSQTFGFVMAQVEASASQRCSSWPFGSFVFCSDDGAICVDDGLAVVKLLHLLLVGAGSSCRWIEDHLKYRDYVGKASRQFLDRSSGSAAEPGLCESSCSEAGVALALRFSGITSLEEPSYEAARACLKIARRKGRAPSLVSAGLAIGLSKITPLRAQIEWYKTSCDGSDDRMGYFDSFKLRGASRRDFKVNMNRIKLGRFWDEVIRMLETGHLPHDFPRRAKWVNASQFYKLLVEPLDIAEYYRTGMHLKRGHYVKHGRERRYEIFDRWWRERESAVSESFANATSRRSKFASLTQDSCFWARVEEARDWLEQVKTERNPREQMMLWENIDAFSRYARTLVERMEISCDVVAGNSSYSLWVEELRELKVQLRQFPPPPPHHPDLVNGEIRP